jgi:predicted Zn-dependent protease with MMP-like domain
MKRDDGLLGVGVLFVSVVKDEHEDFVKVAEETFDSLPEGSNPHQNVAILVEDFPANSGQRRRR